MCLPPETTCPECSTMATARVKEHVSEKRHTSVL